MNETPTDSLPSPVFTTARIAAALGRSRQAATAALAVLPETSIVRVNGQATKAHSVAAIAGSPLTSRLWGDLIGAARRAGYSVPSGLPHVQIAAVEKFLSEGPRAWRPAILLSQVSELNLTEANLLKRALAPSIARRHRTDLTSDEREELGCAEYKAVFGRDITPRHFRNLLGRTVERAGVIENFERLEIYLSDRLTKKIEPRRTEAAPAPQFPELDRLLSRVAGIAPTPKQRNDVWHRAFQQVKEEGRARCEVLKHLRQTAPFLAASAEALQTAWKRKWRTWTNGGCRRDALIDDPFANSGNWRAPELLPEERKLLLATADKLRSAHLAWNFLCTRGQLRLEITSYYPAKKCPRRIYEGIRYDLPLVRSSSHGKRRERDDGAHVERDPDSFKPMEWDQSDDMTFVNVMWEPAPTPEGYWFGQPQFLPWIDERSWFIYSYVLISDSHYNAFNIRNSWTVKAIDWGLPHCGLALERGIWENSTLLHGRSDGKRGVYTVNRTIEEPIKGRADEIDPFDTERGLERLNLKFHHYTRAPGKVIERVFGDLQKYFQSQPGYVGRNPLTDRYEDTYKKIALVKAGKAHPSEFFPSKAQWCNVIDGICLEFNSKTKDGKYHKGLSPKQVFKALASGKAMRPVEERDRYIVAQNLITKRVGKNGITFKFGRQQFTYKNEITGQLRGQQIKCWFNPERPAFLACTSLDDEQPFVVPRSTVVPMHDEDGAALRQALRENAQHNKYQKDLYRSLRHYYDSNFIDFRVTVTSPAAQERGAAFARLTQEAEQQQAEESAATEENNRVYGQYNRPVPESARRDRAAVKDAKIVNDFLNSTD